MDLRRYTDEEINCLRLLIGQTLWAITSQEFEYEKEGLLKSWPDGDFTLEYGDERAWIRLENRIQDIEGYWDMPKIFVSSQPGPAKLTVIQTPSNLANLTPDQGLNLQPRPADIRIITIELLEMAWDEYMNDEGLRLRLSNGQELVFAGDNSILQQIFMGFTPIACDELAKYMRVRLTLA